MAARIIFFIELEANISCQAPDLQQPVSASKGRNWHHASVRTPTSARPQTHGIDQPLRRWTSGEANKQGGCMGGAGTENRAETLRASDRDLKSILGSLKWIITPKTAPQNISRK